MGDDPAHQALGYGEILGLLGDKRIELGTDARKFRPVLASDFLVDVPPLERLPVSHTYSPSRLPNFPLMPLTGGFHIRMSPSR